MLRDERERKGGERKLRRTEKKSFPWPPMAAPVPVDFARSSWYQRVRTAEMNSVVVVVVARRMVAVARRYQTAKPW